MKKLKIFTIVSCLFFLNISFAQEKPPRVLVMGVPQYMFKNGIRIDIDIASKDYKSWWVISPHFYVRVSDIGYSDKFKQMHGYGLSIYRKGFLSRKHVEKGIYLSGGVGYQYFNILTDGERWEEFNEDGSSYMQLVRDDYHVNINKVLADAIIGYQKELFSRMYVDIYVGVGVRYSFYDQPSGSDTKFNNSSVDYGYTGTALIGGLRFGVGF